MSSWRKSAAGEILLFYKDTLVNDLCPRKKKTLGPTAASTANGAVCVGSPARRATATRPSVSEKPRRVDKKQESGSRLVTSTQLTCQTPAIATFASLQVSLPFHPLSLNQKRNKVLPVLLQLPLPV